MEIRWRRYIFVVRNTIALGQSALKRSLLKRASHLRLHTIGARHESS